MFEFWEIHPALVHFPIALLLAGVAVNLWAIRRPRKLSTRAAAGLLVAGVISGWVAAAAGMLAFLTVPAYTEQSHGWMYWHLGLGLASMVTFTALAVVRWRRRAEPPRVAHHAAGLAGVVPLCATGFLGHLLVFRGGAGVDPELLAPHIREQIHYDEGRRYRDPPER